MPSAPGHRREEARHADPDRRCRACHAPAQPPRDRAATTRTGGGAVRHRSGQGVNVGQQADTIFVSWFAYDEAGKGMWVVLSGQLDSTGHVVSGTFYRTTGPALGTTFDPAKVVATPVGNGTLTFSDMHHATLKWSVDGKAGTLDLVRQSYGASRLGGRYEGTTDGDLIVSGNGPRLEPMTMPMHGPISSRSRPRAASHRHGPRRRLGAVRLERHLRRRAARPCTSPARPAARRPGDRPCARSYALRARSRVGRLAEDLDSVRDGMGMGCVQDRAVRGRAFRLRGRLRLQARGRNSTMWFLS